MPSFFRQLSTIIIKNLLLCFVRTPFLTFIRSFVIPVLITLFITVAQNIFTPPSTFGINQAALLREFPGALLDRSSERTRLAFVNNGFTNGDINKVIVNLSSKALDIGVDARTFEDPDSLLDFCHSSLRGVSHCIAAATFYSSPNEGSGGTWNYSIHVDAALDSRIYMDRDNNGAQIYAMPLQRAIDQEIANLNASGHPLPRKVMEYGFTTKSEKQRSTDVRLSFIGTVINFAAVGYLIGVFAVMYQLTGLIAVEREISMSQLIDCMLPARSPWGAQMIRVLAAHIALDAIYAPGWIANAVVISVKLFTQTNFVVILVLQLLGGLSLASFATFIAAFFKQSQLSGICSVIIPLLLGIIAQLVSIGSAAGIYILSLLFPPMNFVYSVILMARFEKEQRPMSLTSKAPNTDWDVRCIVLWILFLIQIIVYPMLATVIERSLYSTRSAGRKETRTGDHSVPAVRLINFSKVYTRNWWSRFVGSSFYRHAPKPVLAVDNLTLDVKKGEIMVLLGANGSGKSTTLTAVSGLSQLTSGKIILDFPGSTDGYGLCPQHNVMWDSLTVDEHVWIFQRLKQKLGPESKEQRNALIDACDLKVKHKARSKTLSGGQKRKLQLAMMFVGGSTICCVDEISSGVDPLSRKKIWDILLAERGSRTILLTTHFLDEADLLADDIAILSRGVLRAHGPSVQLKHDSGANYRVHVTRVPGFDVDSIPEIPDIPRSVLFSEVIYTLAARSEIIKVVSQLELSGITDFRISSPTIEDVFLQVTHDSFETDTHVQASSLDRSILNDNNQGVKLLDGQQVTLVRQAHILFMKRWTILRRNSIPYLAAFLLPVIAAGCVTLFIIDMDNIMCSGTNTSMTISQGATSGAFQLVVGPSQRFSSDVLDNLSEQLMRFYDFADDRGRKKDAHDLVEQSFKFVDNLNAFNEYVRLNFGKLTPGGFYVGDDSHTPTFVWRANGGAGSIAFAVLIQNLMDQMLTGLTINAKAVYFDIPWSPGYEKSLKLLMYFCLAMAAYPAFFALYPTIERVRSIRSMHFSNGVRSLPLWSAYLLFDAIIVLFVSAFTVAIWRAVTDIWYGLGYVFVVLFLYGVAGTLLAYIISLIASSQLGSFAIAAGYEALFLVIYLMGYLSILTFSNVQHTDKIISLFHHGISVFAPICSLTRGLILALNLFSADCRNKELASNPRRLSLYGAPILYLAVQSILLFLLLLWWQNKFSFRKHHHFCARSQDDEKTINPTLKYANQQLDSSNDGLRVLNLNKSFKKFVAVEDVSFGVPRGEVFALLGPNGAGKSTTISMIRGDISPSTSFSEIFIRNVSLTRYSTEARFHLSVCPQFDAMDQMTVTEQLQFYARVRGVSDIQHNVEEVIRAVGLDTFRARLAADLSGGNRRKLSLGIALIGNPTVLLLDEPSSGMDAASKRVMWRTLASIVPGRALVLTTHSMEEADALASRVGIIAKRMLVVGTTDELRQKYSSVYHIHIVHEDAPHSSTEDMEKISQWVLGRFNGARIEQKMYHGQLRFTVPAVPFISQSIAVSQSSSSLSSNVLERNSPRAAGSDKEKRDMLVSLSAPDGDGSVEWVAPLTIGSLFTILESNKKGFGFEHYSIGHTSLDQVFSEIVGKHFSEQ